MSAVISRIPVLLRRACLMSWDVLAWTIAFFVFVLTRYDLRLSAEQWPAALTYLLLAVAMQLAVGLLSQVYLGRSRVGSYDEATLVGGSALAVAVTLGATLPLLLPELPRGIAMGIPPLALTFIGAGRWLFRAALAAPRSSREESAERAIIYGAGDAGHQVARLVNRAVESPYAVVGVVDDDPGKRFLRVHGHRVLGTGADVVERALECDASVVILAISNAPPSLIQRLSDSCRNAGLRLVVVPPVREMIGGQVRLSQLREANVVDLLGRRPIRTRLSDIAGYVTGKVVLITGAGGSIG